MQVGEIVIQINMCLYQARSVFEAFIDLDDDNSGQVAVDEFYRYLGVPKVKSHTSVKVFIILNMDINARPSSLSACLGYSTLMAVAHSTSPSSSSAFGIIARVLTYELTLKILNAFVFFFCSSHIKSPQIWCPPHYKARIWHLWHWPWGPTWYLRMRCLTEDGVSAILLFVSSWVFSIWVHTLPIFIILN